MKKLDYFIPDTLATLDTSASVVEWRDLRAHVAKIQKDAFDSGKKAGWEEAMKACDCSVLMSKFGELKS